ncbi:MAG: DUF1178 family protein [Sulfitobacter sp.]
MIHYALKCGNGHDFDSWFHSAAAFDALSAAGHLNCSVCGSGDVKKAIMAPRVISKSATAPTQIEPVPNEPAPVPVLKTPKGSETDIEAAVAELRKKVEETSDYVGKDFTNQARAMHLGDVPERAIYGEARPDQARSLIEDGVPLLPLPFRPRQKLS